MHNRIFLLLLPICFILACGANQVKTPTPPPNFCTIIDAEPIKNAIRQSGNNEVVVNVYPIKKSADESKQDIELVVLFQDVSGKSISLPGEENSKELEQGLTNFVSYMHQSKMPEVKIPHGYSFKIDSLQAFTNGKFNICIEPITTLMWYCNETDMKQEDSAGKCPPDCCPQRLAVAAKRTAAPCPPGCNGNLIYSRHMEKAIADIYRGKK